MPDVRRYDPHGPIDLHTHSIESDGTEAPGEVIAQASQAGITVLALTDHDTTSGWPQAAAAARKLGVTFIPGVELSAQIGRASVHVLGYLFDPEHPGLLASMAHVREQRLDRARRMVELIAADHDIGWQDVLDVSGDDATIGRPHIADALVRRGIVPSRSAAFASILHWRGGYYVPHEAPDPATCVRLVREAGGVPVLAHPATRGSGALAGETLRGLVDAGLMGLEIGHRENDEASRVVLRGFARAYGLIVTGSSDYHGAGKPNRLAEHTTEPEMLDRIIAAATGTSPVYPDHAAPQRVS